MTDHTPASEARSRWTVAAVLSALLLVPSWVVFDAPFWDLRLERYPQLLVVLLGSSIALLSSRPLRWRRNAGILLSVGVTTLVFAVVWAFQWLRPDLPFSRAIFLLSYGVTLMGAVAQASGEKWVIRSVGGLAAAASLVVALLGLTAWQAGSGGGASAEGESRSTAYHPVRIEYFDGVVPSEQVQPGGGLTRVGDAFVGATGSGAFYLLRLDQAEDSVRSERLPIAAPTNAEVFDSLAPSRLRRSWFRVTDIAARSLDDGQELWASHHHYDARRDCVTMHLSSLLLDSRQRPHGGWHIRFTARPCLSLSTDLRGNPFVGLESGGRMAWLEEDRLLVTLGDHGHDGWNRPLAAAQSDSSDYGKIVLLDLTSDSVVRFTSGHRNPQGLTVGRDGRIWSTEHGPKGGDELNLIVEGGNYGWPYQTYGTEYGRFRWPVAREDAPHAAVPPVFTWVPSIGVSSLLEVGGTMFERWAGDLLISSLKAETLYRVDFADDAVHVVEPILLGRRVRDLVEDRRGRLWLWGERGELVRISLDESRSAGEELFASCAGCHPTEGLSGGLGPDLQGVFGRPIASLEDFPYSPALESMNGRWTRPRLEAFIQDPSGFAPGTTMEFGGIQDPADRAAIIDYLEGLP